MVTLLLKLSQLAPCIFITFITIQAASPIFAIRRRNNSCDCPLLRMTFGANSPKLDLAIQNLCRDMEHRVLLLIPSSRYGRRRRCCWSQVSVVYVTDIPALTVGLLASNVVFTASCTGTRVNRESAVVPVLPSDRN